MSLADKRNAIDPAHKLSVSRQCKLLDLHRSSHYRSTPSDGESPYNLMLMRLIDEIYTRHPFYGSRKIRRWLEDHGHTVNRKRVQRLMALMGIASIAPSPFTSKANKQHKKYPYLLENLDINRPNQVWCTDITYIRMKDAFVYLTAVMDWFSRCILSWEVSITMDTEFCISAVESAIRRNGKPEIFNSDQGAQYTSDAFTSLLKGHEIAISMDGKGRWVDNVLAERLWRSIKYEDVYIKDYESVRELIDGLREYFRFYNEERRHQSLDEHRPIEIYKGEEMLAEAA